MNNMKVQIDYWQTQEDGKTQVMQTVMGEILGVYADKKGEPYLMFAYEPLYMIGSIAKKDLISCMPLN